MSKKRLGRAMRADKSGLIPRKSSLLRARRVWQICRYSLLVGLQEFGAAFAVVSEGSFERGFAFAVGLVGDDDLGIQ